MTKVLRGKRTGRRQCKDIIVGVPDGFRADDWIRDLRIRYEVQEEPLIESTAVALDTFDGRLFEEGLTCSSSQGMVRLHSIDGSSKAAEVAVEPPPRFAADFPEGNFKARLLPVAKNRALLKVLSMSTLSQSWRILNQDQKTVARVVLKEVKVCDETQSAQLGPFVVLKAVRGYEQIAREMAEWFEEQGLKHLVRPVHLQALEALNKTPKQNLPSSRTKLMASMPASDAIRSLLGSLYETVRVNEAGVLRDMDTEFLHDYRVAVRKARSLVGQTSGVFRNGSTARFRKSLSWLGKSTNALRDLDVHLSQQNKYRNLLRPSLKVHVEPLFAFLQGEREKTFQAFVSVMNSQRYADVLCDWGTLVEDPGFLGLGRKGLMPIEDLARRRIAKKGRTVLERGYELTEATGPADLHGFRVECKQLRYLMEFFGEIVTEAQDLIPRMKKLQDNLGSIQDLTVAEEQLQKYLTGAAINDEGASTAMATKELILHVCAQRTRAQEHISKLFARFCESLGETHPPYSLLLPWLRVGPQKH